ncbi:MAG: hypothetical protein WA428_01370 [Candidatus Cybelea sp.]
MKTFSQSGYGSGGCGSDTTTGNLAVPFGTFDGSEAVGFVAVYQNASGNPAIYNLNGMAPNYCGYDNKGDLFCDGVTAYGDQFLFAELPKGGNALESIALNQSIGFGGLVQWDGRYITGGRADFRGSAAKQRSVKHLYHAALRNATGLLSIA